MELREPCSGIRYNPQTRVYEQYVIETTKHRETELHPYSLFEAAGLDDSYVEDLEFLLDLVWCDLSHMFVSLIAHPNGDLWVPDYGWSYRNLIRHRFSATMLRFLYQGNYEDKGLTHASPYDKGYLPYGIIRTDHFFEGGIEEVTFRMDKAIPFDRSGAAKISEIISTIFEDSGEVEFIEAREKQYYEHPASGSSIWSTPFNDYVIAEPPANVRDAFTLYKINLITDGLFTERKDDWVEF